MIDFPRQVKPTRSVSLVPLINVVFLLLIFFLVAGSVEKIDVIDVSLPEATSGERLDEGYVQILLGRYGEVIVNNEPVALNQLTAMLKPQMADNPERIITVKADGRMSAIRMIEMMEQVKAAGAVNISLTTQER